ncbi:hypothetical protein ATCC90586_007464 [Pythium insidiosum]|nr:hypothetical protein ATCC90586_007464 [Pythium insidiosum]
MGVFSALYGEVTGRIVRQSDKLEYRVGIFSSAISLIIGVLWIVLLATGSMGSYLLTALIMLSAGSSWRLCQLGMRLGVGCSVGLIVVTAIFLALHKL